MIEHNDHTTNELEVLEKYVRVCLCRCEWKKQSSGSNATVVCPFDQYRGLIALSMLSPIST